MIVILLIFYSILSSHVAAEYGTCKSCYDGYSGNQCTQPICYGETSCLNGGTCSSPDNCTCPEKYIGSKCEQATCFGIVTCPNGGTCISPDKCLCASGFTGEKCETESGGHSGNKSSEAVSINKCSIVTLSLMMMMIQLF